MDFKRIVKIPFVIPSVVLVLLIGVLTVRFFPREASASVIQDTEPTLSMERPQTSPVPAVIQDDFEQDAQIEQELAQDREEQKQTKLLKNKLEQSNLQLEDEKVIAEINKLKTENMGNFKDLSDSTENSFPAINVEYIGGDEIQKEAVLSIAGSNFQVKEHSKPTDKIQVLSISDSSVTLHFDAPYALTKTFEFKPE